MVKVAEGYGRNFLLPRGLAMAVTDANKAMIEKEKKAHDARMAKEKAEFEALAERIGGLRFIAPRKVGENDAALRLGHLGRHGRVPEGQGHRDRQAQGPARRADQEASATTRSKIKLHPEVGGTLKLLVTKEG